MLELFWFNFALYTYYLKTILFSELNLLFLSKNQPFFTISNLLILDLSYSLKNNYLPLNTLIF